jgi:hypothetical protein
MTNPIGIIAANLWGLNPEAFRLAEAAASALTDDRIVANAAAALRANGWQDHDGVTAETVARTVLRSVGA